MRVRAGRIAGFEDDRSYPLPAVRRVTTSATIRSLRSGCARALPSFPYRPVSSVRLPRSAPGSLSASRRLAWRDGLGDDPVARLGQTPSTSRPTSEPCERVMRLGDCETPDACGPRPALVVTRVVLRTGHQRGSCCPKAATDAGYFGPDVVAALRPLRKSRGDG